MKGERCVGFMVVGVLMVVGFSVIGVMAFTLSGWFTDSCYDVSFVDGGGMTGSLAIANTCYGVMMSWSDAVNLSILGNVTDGEVVFGNGWAFVNKALRPDLDAHAVITFYNVSYAVAPDVLKDGNPCGAPECNMTYNSVSRTVVVVVDGFSNYSLTGRADFTVDSDPQPELKGKTYMTVDLGDSNRDEEFACIVQMYGRSSEGTDAWVLVQTNPQRDVQAKLFGSPDPNQPESLGYFPTKGGLANVYFDGGSLAGYSDLERVIQCSSNSTKLVNEEAISTRYSPFGRSVVARGVWFTSGNNALYLIVAVIALLFGSFIVMGVYRKAKGR